MKSTFGDERIVLVRVKAICDNGLMHIHILGICGTFMGSLAVLARQLGYRVTGSDQNVYPPMSLQLEAQGIELSSGYKEEHLKPAPDLVVIGNTCSRGNPAVEYVLNEKLPYSSGPQWLHDHVLKKRWVLAVAGTHGKTTTTSMLAWILEYAGLKPGYLIGGVPGNFDYSADIGSSDYFVIEADEYDSAFFDKRSKFIHYNPTTAIIGNLEFDHADIFRDLEDIQRQFQHFVKIMPGKGLLVLPDDSQAINEVTDRGTWSPSVYFGETEKADIRYRLLENSGSCFSVSAHDETYEVEWSLCGTHNVRNATAALTAAQHAGVSLKDGAAALKQFKGVKRRLELLTDAGGIRLYDDFAHHPTAIKQTLSGLRASMKSGTRLIAVIEARSNTMKMGYHQNTIAASLADADIVFWYSSPDSRLDLEEISKDADCHFNPVDNTPEIVDRVINEVQRGDRVVIMSNGGFENIHLEMKAALEARF